MEFETFKGTVDVPESESVSGGRRPSHPFTVALVDWLGTKDKSLKVKCKNVEEARVVQCLASGYRRNHKLDFTIYKRGTEVYCIKA